MPRRYHGLPHLTVIAPSGLGRAADSSQSNCGRTECHGLRFGGQVHRPCAVAVQAQRLNGGNRDLFELDFGFLRPGVGRGPPPETGPHDGEPDQRGDEAGRVRGADRRSAEAKRAKTSGSPADGSHCLRRPPQIPRRKGLIQVDVQPSRNFCHSRCPETAIRETAIRGHLAADSYPFVRAARDDSKLRCLPRVPPISARNHFSCV